MVPPMIGSHVGVSALAPGAHIPTQPFEMGGKMGGSGFGIYGAGGVPMVGAYPMGDMYGMEAAYGMGTGYGEAAPAHVPDAGPVPASAAGEGFPSDGIAPAAPAKGAKDAKEDTFHVVESEDGCTKLMYKDDAREPCKRPTDLGRNAAADLSAIMSRDHESRRQVKADPA
jgi:hypothetical protein